MDYKILFSGHIRPGFNKETVKKATSELLKIPLGKAEQLFSGKTFALAKNLNAKEALEKTELFNNIGLEIKVVSESPNSETVTEQSNVPYEKLKEAASQLGKKVQDTLKKQRKNTSPVSEVATSSSKKSKRNWQLIYFSIVRWFSFSVATVAIIIVLVSGYIAVSTFLSVSKNDHIEPKPLTYESLDKIQRGQEDARYASSEQENNSEQFDQQIKQTNRLKEKQEKIDALFLKFEKNMNQYAKALGQASVKEIGTNSIKDYIQSYDDLGKPFVFWNTVVTFSEDLSLSSKEIAGLNEGNLRRVDWVKSLEWLATNYRDNIDAVQRAKNNKKVKQAVALSEASTTLMVTGVAFLVFMLFTVILVLLKIESNTRAKNINTV